MSDFGGGIPSQVIGELASIPKQVLKDASKAVGDITTGTLEKVTSVGSTQPSSGNDQGTNEQGQTANDPMVAIKAQKDAAAKRRLSEVRSELQEYFENKKRKEQHQEMAAEEQKKQEDTVKKNKKKQEEQDVLQRLSSQYGGTGEVAKGGN